MTTIVLAHGFPGFAKFGRLTYFRDVAAFLEDELGVKVLTPDVGPFGLIEERALKLKEAIEAESDRVHIIAHSAGGIDARYLISPEGLELADRVASVTTVSTPHQGASIAEAALGSLNFASLKELTSNSPEIDSDRMKRIRDSLLGAVQDRKGSFLPKMLGRFLTRMQGVFDSSLPFPSLESTKPEVSRLALGLFGVKELTVTLKVEIEQYTRKSMELFNKEHKVPGNVKFFPALAPRDPEKTISCPQFSTFPISSCFPRRGRTTAGSPSARQPETLSEERFPPTTLKWLGTISPSLVASPFEGGSIIASSISKLLRNCLPVSPLLARFESSCTGSADGVIGLVWAPARMRRAIQPESSTSCSNETSRQHANVTAGSASRERRTMLAPRVHDAMRG